MKEIKIYSYNELPHKVRERVDMEAKRQVIINSDNNSSFKVILQNTQEIIKGIIEEDKHSQIFRNFEIMKNLLDKLDSTLLKTRFDLAISNLKYKYFDEEGGMIQIKEIPKE